MMEVRKIIRPGVHTGYGVMVHITPPVTDSGCIHSPSRDCAARLPGIHYFFTMFDCCGLSCTFESLRSSIERVLSDMTSMSCVCHEGWNMDEKEMLHCLSGGEIGVWPLLLCLAVSLLRLRD